MKKILTPFLLVILLVGCTESKQYEKNTTWLEPFNDAQGNMVLPLNTDIKLITVNKDLQDEMNASLKDTVIFYHRLLDSHHYYEEDGKTINNLKVINDSYGSEEKIKIDPLLMEALKESFALAHLTAGYFNPTVGKLSELWKDLFNEDLNSDPEKEDVEKALACVIPADRLQEFIELDEEDSTVIFHRYDACEDEVIIDLGGFSKGYVLDKAYEELKRYGTSFLIDGGSSSVISYVAGGEDIDWTIGIRRPDGDDTLYGFDVTKLSLSTSGDDERYFLTDVDGKQVRRHHIIDPHDGYSANHFRVITLLSDSHAGVLDALSTALFNVEDITVQDEIIEKTSSYYDIDIKRCLVKEEDDRLYVIIDKEFNDLLRKDLDSLDIYEKIIIE